MMFHRKRLSNKKVTIKVYSPSMIPFPQKEVERSKKQLDLYLRTEAMAVRLQGLNLLLLERDPEITPS